MKKSELKLLINQILTEAKDIWLQDKLSELLRREKTSLEMLKKHAKPNIDPKIIKNQEEIVFHISKALELILKYNKGML